MKGDTVDVQFRIEFQAEFTIPSLGDLTRRMKIEYPVPEIRFPFSEQFYTQPLRGIPTDLVHQPIWIFSRSGGSITENLDVIRKVLVKTIPYVFTEIETPGYIRITGDNDDK